MFPSLFLSRITNFLSRSQREIVRIRPIAALYVMFVCVHVRLFSRELADRFFWGYRLEFADEFKFWLKLDFSVACGLRDD